VWLAALLVAVTAGGARGQDAAIQSGPMVGHGEAREVKLWVQTTGAAEVHFRYHDATNPDREWRTASVRTSASTAYVAEAAADSVEPGRRYVYEVWIDGREAERPYPLSFQTPMLWQWRTDPPPFTIALASCFYVNEPVVDRPGNPYGSNFQILEALTARAPDLMLWLGDNTYLREVDWWSRTGILRRHTHTRSLPELQPLLGSTHHLAIWDDHDYGPNDSDRAYVGKGWTREAFDLFWANPPAVPDLGGITTTFEWADVQFFLLDDRWHRSPNDRRTGEREMLGEAQIEWLVDALASSHARFKIVAVGGQVLNPAARFENYATYPEERAHLLEAIEAEGITGVIFLTGDRHHTELTRLDRAGTYPLYDLTVSPLTAGLASPDTTNTLQVEGTYVREHNFAILSFDGPRDERRLTISIVGADGAERWSRTILASELR
jgi:alkaline phosphatase D